MNGPLSDIRSLGVCIIQICVQLKSGAPLTRGNTEHCGGRCLGVQNREIVGFLQGKIHNGCLLPGGSFMTEDQLPSRRNGY